MDLLADVRAGTQAGIGANQGAGSDPGAFQVAEGADHCTRLDADSRREDDVGLDLHAGLDPRVPGKVHGLRRGHDHPLG